MTITDISVPLREGMPVWPGSIGYQAEELLSVRRGDVANVSGIRLDIHTGTHIDAPLHFFDGAGAVDTISLDTLVGSAVVVAVEGSAEICARALEEASIPPTCRRLLLKTSNSSTEWHKVGMKFCRDFSALTRDAADWLVQRQIQLVGIDYLSIERFERGTEVHEVLLDAGVVILEGIWLGDVQPGEAELICMPLHLPGCEAAPARAILRR